MKISTDSVLVGSWPELKKAKSILDIGTGTGIIALMSAQRSNAFVDAIDIDQNSCESASRNFSRSKWANRMAVHHSTLQGYVSNKKYDVIISNPPFFPVPKSHNKGVAGGLARYTHSLSFGDLAEHVTRLLDKKGKFFVILPIQESANFADEAERRKLFLTKCLWVKTTNLKKFPKRILMQFEFNQKSEFEDAVLIIQEGGLYTNAYKLLTKDFYVKF